MGADGGVCWLFLKNREEFNQLAGWLIEQTGMLNSSCNAYESEFRTEVFGPTKGDYIEGGYGTDCTNSLERLEEMVRYCQDSGPPYRRAQDGSEDVRDYTFEELYSALLSDPSFELWKWYRTAGGDFWWADYTLGTLVEVIVDHLRTQVPREDGFIHSPNPYNVGIPDRFMQMTLREWATKVWATIDGCSSEENWT